VLLGQLQLKIPDMVQTTFFNLFIFVIGYRTGPQFFRGLKKESLQQVVLALVLAVTSVLCVWLVSLVMGYDKGTAAGLFAGSMTQSAVFGSATDAINQLPMADDVKRQLVNNIPVSYAVTYVFGSAGLAFFLSKAGPKLLKTDLRAACRELENEMSGGEPAQPGVATAYTPGTVRAYRLETDAYAGHSVADVEKSFNHRLIILRIRQQGEVVESTPGLVLRKGDDIAIAAYRDALKGKESTFGPERLDDEELLDIQTETLDVVLTSKEVDGMTLGQITTKYPPRVRLIKVIRVGQEMPFTNGTVLNRGDTLRLIGTRRDVERAAKRLGYADRPADSVDMVYVAMGIALGALLGAPALMVGGISLTLSTTGGILIAGLFFGWLRSRYPVFGRFPEPAMWVFEMVGLTVFVAAIGLSAGPSFVQGLQEKGIGLLMSGAIVVLLPHTLTIWFSKKFLNLNAGVLLGACCGAGTSTPALMSVQEEAGSKVPALGYTVPYAVGSTLLTACGPLIVALVK
jgi:putative transport protein